MLKVEIPAVYLHDFMLYGPKTTPSSSSRKREPVDSMLLDSNYNNDNAFSLPTSLHLSMSDDGLINSTSTVCTGTPTMTTTNTIASTKLAATVEDHATSIDSWSILVPDFEVPEFSEFDKSELYRRESALLSQVDWEEFGDDSLSSLSNCSSSSSLDLLASPYVSSCDLASRSTSSNSIIENDDEDLFLHNKLHTSIITDVRDVNYSAPLSVSMSAVVVAPLEHVAIEITPFVSTDITVNANMTPTKMDVTTKTKSKSTDLKRPRSSSSSNTPLSMNNDMYTPSSSLSGMDDDASPKERFHQHDDDEDEDEDDDEEDEEEEQIKARRPRKRQAKMLTPPSTGSEEDSPVSTPGGTGVRKVSHNEMERKRRGELRMEFQRLRAHLPKLASDKAPKITILNEANAYIDSLHTKITNSKAVLLKLSKDRDALRRQLEQARSR